MAGRLPELQIPNGHASVDSYLNELQTNMHSADPFSMSPPSHEVQAADEVQQADDTADEVPQADNTADEVQKRDSGDDHASEDVNEEEPGPEVVYERDLRSSNKRDIDYNSVYAGTEVYVFASRHSGAYSYIVDESYEATLANKKEAQRQARMATLKAMQTPEEKDQDDVILLNELKSARKYTGRTKKIDRLEAIAEGCLRAFNFYEAAMILDNDRLKRDTATLARIRDFNHSLVDPTDVMRNPMFKPQPGKKRTKPNAPY